MVILSVLVLSLILMMHLLVLMVKLVDSFVKGFSVDTDNQTSKGGWIGFAVMVGWSLGLVALLILIVYAMQT